MLSGASTSAAKNRTMAIFDFSPETTWSGSTANAELTLGAADFSAKIASDYLERTGRFVAFDPMREDVDDFNIRKYVGDDSATIFNSHLQSDFQFSRGLNLRSSDADGLATYATGGEWNTLEWSWRVALVGYFKDPADAKVRVRYGGDKWWNGKTKQEKTLDGVTYKTVKVDVAWSTIGARIQIKPPSSTYVDYFITHEGTTTIVDCSIPGGCLCSPLPSCLLPKL